VLAVVEDDEHGAAADRGGQLGTLPLSRRSHRSAVEAEAAPDGGDETVAVHDAGQVDHPRPTFVPAADLEAHLYGQAGLACAAGAGEGDQAGGVEGLLQRPYLLVPSHARGQRPNEVARPDGHRRRPRCSPIEVKPGVLGQDGRLQRPQLGPGLDAELLTQRPASVLERSEGVGLATRPVQGEHQHAPEPLPERVGGDHRLQLVEAVEVAAEGELGLDPILGGRPAKLVETGALGAGELVEDKVGQGVSAPEPECFAEQFCCVTRRSFLHCGTTLGDESGEAQGIHLVGVHVEHVAGWLGKQHLAGAGLAQRPPDLRHDKVEGVGGLLREFVAVETFDEPVRAHHMAGVERQDRSQRPQLLAAKGDRRAVPRRHLQRA
jgi:hypothetical protein